MKAVLAVLVLVAGALAGCAGQGTGSSSAQTQEEGCAFITPPNCPVETVKPGSMVIAGIVESNALVPLPSANVTLYGYGVTVQTDSTGRFSFPGVQASVYTVRAEHAGFAIQDKVARPDFSSLQFILERAQPTQPYNVTLPPLHGYFECASEEAIGSGSCDLFVQFADGGKAVLGNTSTFPFQTDLGWSTVVMDLVFDAANNPGIDGMRMTLRAANGTAALNTYQQYGHFYGKTSFSTRVEPHGNYTDGVAPVPANVTAFKVDVYPQGYEWHKACTPDLPVHAAECFDGAGAAINLRFDLYVTVFYVTPAPPGFTLIGK